MDYFYQRHQKETLSHTFARSRLLVIFSTMIFTLSVYPVLRMLGAQIHVFVSGGYMSGHHSVLLINCPTEQAAKDIGRVLVCTITLDHSRVVLDLSLVLNPCSIAISSKECCADAKIPPIPKHIMEKRMAACVNVLPRTSTMYYWKGEIQDASEILLLVRTRTSVIQKLTDYVKAMHPYEIPEIISFPIEDGSMSYFKWMDDAVPEV
ncbi:hypothetical protein P4O66_016103 [Electrophorus voltai]|uniref:CutA divalent cation tolerance homolog n=1 Tax=Electrophorus voltai TaxID=2609070 RepID=A0AAD8YX75_9TELE|nr:hypothetical protein P4O66_016103 [Electrophorus voltai]